MSEAGSEPAAEAQRKGRPRIPEARQRERLFDAAERLFERGGEEGVSVQAIVREARMSSRSFYEFFVSKDDLVVALARHRANAFVDELEAGMRARAATEPALEGLVAAYAERLPLVLVDLERLGGRGRAGVRAVRARLRMRVQALLEGEIEGLAARGDIDAPPSSTLLALLLAGLDEWVVERRRYDTAGAPDARELVATLCAAMRGR